MDIAPPNDGTFIPIHTASYTNIFLFSTASKTSSKAYPRLLSTQNGGLFSQMQGRKGAKLNTHLAHRLRVSRPIPLLYHKVSQQTAKLSTGKM